MKHICYPWGDDDPDIFDSADDFNDSYMNVFCVPDELANRFGTLKKQMDDLETEIESYDRACDECLEKIRLDLLEAERQMQERRPMIRITYQIPEAK